MEGKPRITPKNVFSYIVGHSLSVVDSTLGLPDYIKEQVAYRATICGDCILLGKCPVCHCTLPEKHYSYHPCDGNRYPALMTKKDWIAYKKEKNIVV